MRVLEIVHGFPPGDQGGTEVYAEAHARALAERFGDRVLVLTRDHDRQRAEYDVRSERRGAVRVVAVNNTFTTTRSFAETYRNEVIGRIADRVIDDFRPDAAHIHHLTGLSTTIVRSLAARGVPCVLTLHDYWLMCHRGQLLDLDVKHCPGPVRTDGSVCHRCLGTAGAAGAVGFAGATAVRAIEQRLRGESGRAFRRAAEGVASMAFSGADSAGEMRTRIDHMRDVCRDVTHFLAPSRDIRDRFVEFGVDVDRITLSPYGIDRTPNPEPRAPRPEPRDDRLRIGFLGGLMVSKGVHVLLEAIRVLPPHAVSVDIYGSHAPYHGDDSYRQRVEPLLVHDDVRVHGSVPHEQVVRAFTEMDVLVVPSIWPENSPLVIHEAFLAGVPVVASAIGGILELVGDEQNGLLFRAGDPGDLARVLTRLLTDPDLLRRLRGRIPAVRTIDEDVEQTRALYETLVSRRRATNLPRKRLAAVVLNHRTPDDTFLAVRSLLASRRPFDDVIVVNNDAPSSPELRLPPPEPRAPAFALRATAGRPSPVSFLTTGRNLGFSGGMNVGIREALARGADRVLLVNSDAIVPPDCVERLERGLEMAPGAGIAAPVILVRSDPDRIESLGVDYSPATGRMWHRGFGTRVADGVVPPVATVDGVSGCVMLITREVLEKVGLLDEDYFFGFEDLDFCAKARRAGFATVVVGGAMVHHEGGSSIGAASARRLYFGARNHLRFASCADPDAGAMSTLWRTLSIVTLNLAYAITSTGAPLPARVAAVVRGTRDYFRGRFGPDSSG